MVDNVDHKYTFINLKCILHFFYCFNNFLAGNYFVMYMYNIIVQLSYIIVKLSVVCLSVMGGQRKRFDLETEDAVSLATER